MNKKETTQKPAGDVGVIGLAVMGANLALNIADRGFTVALYNRTPGVAEKLAGEESRDGRRLVPTASLEEFIASLKPPRRIILMVKAGPPVDAVIEQLVPLLDKGDIIADGGNSHYPDTSRRSGELEAAGLRFLGMGVSGGEDGARHGPSIMPGGSREAFDALRPVLEKIAAVSDSGPCVAYMGSTSAGHFVKMVHNGIEYADMQLIAEAYPLLRDAAGMKGRDIAALFAEWNRGPLASYLIEITADIVNRQDPETGELMVDVILDAARQKGTGKWTTGAALDLGVPVPSITSAVDARLVSALKEERVAASHVLAGPGPAAPPADAKSFAADLEQALLAAKIGAYAQGFALMAAASKEFGYQLDMSEIARIWKAGCIIRAALLDRIRQAYARKPDLANLMVDESFAADLTRADAPWRRVATAGINAGIAMPAFSSALAYYDSYRTARLPASLTQAQRDYFGAHTYERVDRDGVFHFDWTPE